MQLKYFGYLVLRFAPLDLAELGREQGISVFSKSITGHINLYALSTGYFNLSPYFIPEPFFWGEGMGSHTKEGLMICSQICG